jgi:HSP20 family molecular chaperone IbpA
MTNVAVQKVEDRALKTLPIFEQIERRLEDVRRRAFELFERRGCGLGRDIEDWLKAEREVLGWPAVEMAENDKEYEFQMTLAGFDAKEVEVTALPSEIIVHAQTKSEKKTEESNVTSTEFGSSDVYRRFELPQPINVDRTKARLDKGVLQITAAKAEAKERTVATAAA